jgi:hypothetical protein
LIRNYNAISALSFLSPNQAGLKRIHCKLLKKNHKPYCFIHNVLYICTASGEMKSLSMTVNQTKGLIFLLFMSLSITLCGQSLDVAGGHNHLVAARVRSQQFTVDSIDQLVLCPVHAGFSIAQYPLCTGNSLQLINASWNATDYKWYLNGALFSVAEHPSLILDKVGQNKFMLVSSSIICSDTAILLLEVFESYDIKVYDTICHGDIYWFMQTPCQVTGTYSFQSLTQKGCDSLVSLYLFVEPADASFVLSGDSAVAVSGGQWYQWCECSSILSPISGATGSVFMPTCPGFYTLIAGNEVCADTADCQYFAVIGIDHPLILKAIKAFPVPANETLFLRGIPETGSYTAEIATLAGKIVRGSLVDYYSPSIDVRDLPVGSYLLRLTDKANNRVNLMFVVARN